MADTFENGENNLSIRNKLNATAGEVNTNTADVSTNKTAINAVGLTAGKITLWDGAKQVDSDITEDETTITMTKELDAPIKTAYTNLYLNAPEPLDITAGQPESPANFTAKFTNLFTYAGGTLTYTGPDAIIKVDGAVSMYASTPNVLVTISFGKNGSATIGTDTEIERKISTGGDVGAAPVAGTFSLTSGNTLDFFVDTDINAVVTITKANFTIHEIARV